jgi:hypothetical protein
MARLLTLIACLTCVATAAERVVFDEDFSDGVDRWEVLDPETWRLNDEGTFEITSRQSAYKPPHRSPYHVALVRDLVVSDVAIEFRVKSTLDTGDHRDCCVFFGWQDPAHFYYVHLGAKPDTASGQIQIVDGADRRPLTDNRRHVPWTDGWHKVRLERSATTGHIAVYFDDLTTPLMEATDKSFGPGRVGIGAFDDRDAFDDVRVMELREPTGVSP